jgi:hypothetical protein
MRLRKYKSVHVNDKSMAREKEADTIDHVADRFIET